MKTQEEHTVNESNNYNKSGKVSRITRHSYNTFTCCLYVSEVRLSTGDCIVLLDLCQMVNN